MRRSYSGALPIVTLVLCAHAASAIEPVDCSDRIWEIRELLDGRTGEEVREEWAKHAQLIREAKPGTSYYAPHAFPKSDEEVVQDFRYVYFEKLFDQGAAALEPSERAIYEGLEAGTIQVSVVRVENWGISRCSDRGRTAFFHLVRLHDPEGQEVARGTILPTGLLGQYGQITEVGARALPELRDLPERVAKFVVEPLKVERARYAAIDGLPLPCGPLLPCAVFEANGSTWILDRSALLFRLGSEASRLSVKDYRTQQAARGLRPLGSTIGERAWITTGFEWRQAELVARDEEMAKIQGVP